MNIRIKKNNYSITNTENRTYKGIGVSPYPLRSLFRYFINSITNGLLSYRNPDSKDMDLLSKSGCIVKSEKEGDASLKVVFLGDIMVSKSGKPPHLRKDLKKILRKADIIVANVESPVVESNKEISKRGLSLNFAMQNSFLSKIHSCNSNAKWVFSIANNHACDTSRNSPEDVSGVETTIKMIHQVIPDAEIIGAELQDSHPVLSLSVDEGPTIGIVGWTEVMNHDKEHYRKPIIRETDLTEKKIKKIKKEHDMLIGFAHGNEEQSYYPLKSTRDRWLNLLSEKKFDLIVGHGPHVLQPAEKVGEQGLLFHSIGNFCSPVGKSQTKIGCIPEITINYKGEEITSTNYKVHLLEQDLNTVGVIKDINNNEQKNIKIINRLRSIWNRLFD